MIAFWIAVAAMIALVIFIIVDETMQSIDRERKMQELAERLADEETEVWIIY